MAGPKVDGANDRKWTVSDESGHSKKENWMDQQAHPSGYTTSSCGLE